MLKIQNNKDGIVTIYQNIGQIYEKYFKDDSIFKKNYKKNTYFHKIVKFIYNLKA